MPLPAIVCRRLIGSSKRLVVCTGEMVIDFAIESTRDDKLLIDYKVRAAVLEVWNTISSASSALLHSLHSLLNKNL